MGYSCKSAKCLQAIKELTIMRIYGLFPGEFYHEIAAQILLVSLRQARRNEHFCILSRSDQDCILRHVWNELFLLHAAYWPIDVSALIRRALNSSHMHQHGTKAATNNTSRLLRRSLELCQNLQLDAIELSLLETLILCRKGKNEQKYHLFIIN
jgi:nuclear receptor